jgi:hypothetical protein
MATPPRVEQRGKNGGEPAFVAALAGANPKIGTAYEMNLPMGQPALNNAAGVLGTQDGKLASLLYAASNQVESTFAAALNSLGLGPQAQAAQTSPVVQQQAAKQQTPWAGIAPAPTPYKSN